MESALDILLLDVFRIDSASHIMPRLVRKGRRGAREVDQRMNIVRGDWAITNARLVHLRLAISRPSVYAWVDAQRLPMLRTRRKKPMLSKL